ncbi:MAG TPA: hypothetical protein VFQ36_20250 [Ktedonobacteraceae bacterium]|nr:hypothetical protein [Ktedonobacteraceae bacterium]
MAIDQHLPPACAFAVSVLVERDMDPDAVPEEAVEAAQHHLVTCARCLSSPPVISPPRKKKRSRRASGPDTTLEIYTPLPVEVAAPPSPEFATPIPSTPRVEANTPVAAPKAAEPSAATSKPVVPDAAPATPAKTTPAPSTLPAVIDGLLNCAQCRQRLQEYAEAMDSGQNVAILYPQVQEHLVTCESGCLVLLEIFREEAKASRKYRRRKVRDPFSAIGWELTGFFRGGQVPMSPMALAYGTLILLLLVSTFSVFFAVRWDDARYYHPPVHKVIIPTPDGIGLSDGLKVFDACNADGYQDKRAAAQALSAKNLTKAGSLLATATSVVSTDTTGCNGAEAAIYSEDLQVRQSGHPYGALVVAFDSGPGVASPQGGTDRHILYAAYTQELIGAYIAQQQYNNTAMQTPGTPLLYLILANTTGVAQGALQIAHTIATLATSPDLHQFGLLASGPLPLLGVLGLAPSSLVQLILPALCNAGVPLIAPTATGLFIINLLEQTSLYRHCAPGFAFVRFSPDDADQSWLAANYAYRQLRVHRAAIFYDPGNPSSVGSADGFSANFTKQRGAQIVARETAVASGLLDTSGRPQTSPEDLLAGLKDALLAKPRPDLIFAPLLTNDVITLAQDIAQLPPTQQPILMIGGEFVHPTALQELVQWARQQQLTLPRIYVSLISAVRPPDNNDWPKQFYASFCTSFAAPGTHCSGAGILDQGGLLFADGVEIVAHALTPATGKNGTPAVSTLPTRDALVQIISQERFVGVSSPIRLQEFGGIMVTSTQVAPVILSVQDDGSLQIVG